MSNVRFHSRTYDSVDAGGHSNSDTDDYVMSSARFYTVLTTVMIPTVTVTVTRMITGWAVSGFTPVLTTVLIPTVTVTVTLMISWWAMPGFTVLVTVMARHVIHTPLVTAKTWGMITWNYKPVLTLIKSTKKPDFIDRYYIYWALPWLLGNVSIYFKKTKENLPR